LSLHGIYRPREEDDSAALVLLPTSQPTPIPETGRPNDAILHPKYGVPACCFAYVGHAAKTSTWKLPCRLADGTVDVKRLPKAIQSILSNYRGIKVSGIPEADIPDVLARLAQAAVEEGRMPHQTGDTAPIYRQPAEVLTQLGRPIG
jgi:hypothetical protein